MAIQNTKEPNSSQKHEKKVRGGDLFIVDNSDADWKVSAYLSEWCELAESIDIATGYFEIGSLLSLKDKWQKVDQIRILMGDEVSMQTKRVFEKGLQKISSHLDNSLEIEKKQNDFLEGVPAIVDAIRSGKIQCKVYRKEKFHAKAYITHARSAVLGSNALVGSSNFTYPGLHDNVELNIQNSGPEVDLLQDWYERYWIEAEEVTPEILRVIERHTQEHSPFEIWIKAIDEYFRGRDLEPDVWDIEQSVVFKQLDKYQQDAYRNLIPIAKRYGGAFLCDGVGLGKTFVGLMLIERLVFKEAKQVVLFAPKAAREDVWEPALKQYLPRVFSGFVNLVIYNHTDLQRLNNWPKEMEITLGDADAVIIDEAHHFRNPGIKGEGVRKPSRYRMLQNYLHSNGRPKELFFLTATPVNNTVHDFRHIIELFTGGNDSFFGSTLGVHGLTSHFIKLEKNILKKLPNIESVDLIPESERQELIKILRADPVFDALVIQRSRSYVKQNQLIHGGSGAIFPERELPKVAPYSIKTTYGTLLESVRTAFQKEHPLFVLGIYYPLAYWKGDKETSAYKSFDEGRQKQVVMLIRTLFLKRFESSSKAFEGSCWRLLKKLLAWVTVHTKSEHDLKRLERWKVKNGELIGYVQARQLELRPEDEDEDEVEEFLNEDILNAVEKLDPKEFDVDAILDDTFDDMDQLVDFLREVARVKPEQDDKLKALIKLFRTDPILKTQKVIIFSEFADTARYLEQELKKAGIDGLERIDGGSDQKHRSDVIRRFAPYYNGSNSAEVKADGKKEIRVLISTDILSEGLNLQDATRLINYDIHWNPVRLMQRIGRVDRRMNPEIEAKIVTDHPELTEFRGKVAFWNFLPPNELDELLKLFQRVTNKVLVISRTLGIEGRTLLTPDDTFDPIKEMNEQYDGILTEIEQLRLEYIELIKEYPDLVAEAANLPLKVFSGREAIKPNSKAVFFCYRIPRPDSNLIDNETGQPRWSDRAGITVWMCIDLEIDKIITEPGAIAELIRSYPDTPRVCSINRQTLSDLRKKADEKIKTDYLKPLQAPVGVEAVLKCWMEVS